MGLSRRFVLRMGYGAVLVLLVFSSWEAYRIQDSTSERHAEVYRGYLKQDEALRRLRQNVFLISTYVRDFFLSTNQDRISHFEADLQSVKTACEDALRQLDHSRIAADRDSVLRQDLAEFWETIGPITRTMAQATDNEEYEFVQREVVPRRTRLYTELLEITEAEQDVLQRNELDFAATRKAALQRLLRTLGLCLTLGLLVAWFSLRHAEHLEAETARQYEEVALTKRELERLSARLLEIEEEGRRSLSRELHDEIGQTLTALRIEIAHALKQADGQQMKDELEHARALAERSVQTVRNICLLLRPALLDDLGLIPALQWQLQEFSHRSGIACQFSESGVEQHLPDSVKTCIYRMVQEALHNCEKHAAAAHIQVSLRQEPGWLTLEVADDGRGFAFDAKHMPGRDGGLGIVGMRERAAMVGGKLSIESSPGKGTRLAATIPLPTELAAQAASAPHEVSL
jgi:signal transduction histidine kinase